MNIDPEKLVVLVLIALLVLGPKRLPEMARQAGKWMAEAKKYTSAIQTEMKDVLAEPRQHTTALRDEFRSALDEPLRTTSSLGDEFRKAFDPQDPIEAASRETTTNFDTSDFDTSNFDTSNFDTSNFDTTTNFETTRTWIMSWRRPVRVSRRSARSGSLTTPTSTNPRPEPSLGSDVVSGARTTMIMFGPRQQAQGVRRRAVAMAPSDEGPQPQPWDGPENSVDLGAVLGTDGGIGAATANGSSSVATDEVTSASLNGHEPDDEELDGVGGRMTLYEHLGELRKRLLICCLAVVVTAVLGYFLYNPVLHFMTAPYRSFYHHHKDMITQQLVISSPTEGFTTRLKVSLYIGIALAAPIWLFELWRFITPGLKHNEKRYAIPFVVSAL